MAGPGAVDDGMHMSSLAYPPEAASRPAAGRHLRAVVERWAADTLLFVIVAGLAIVLLSGVAQDFNVDSWLALATGRLVWEHGIPHHEVLTALSLGHRWIDQQWLSQLADYGAYRLGGLGLLGLFNVALLVSAVAVSIVTARRLGAPFRSVLIVVPVCLAAISPSREVRTQELALPLFAAVVWLLAADSRRPSRRVLWCLPVLVLWANLHGTVTLGATLVALRGLTVAWERRGLLGRSLRAWARPAVLVIGPLLAILVTPYGSDIVGYYRDTMVSSTLRHFVTEWQPVTAFPVTAAATFALGAAALWSFGRSPQRTTLWEKLALLLVCASTVSVSRNAVFLGLIAIVVVSLSLGWGPPGRSQLPGRAAINGLLVAASVALAIVVAVTTVARAGSAIEYRFQRPGVLAAVRSASTALPGVRVFAQQDFADWLLWRDPALDGRVANDVRFELLTARQLSAINAVYGVIGTDWKRAARGYRVLVLSRSDDPAATRAFEREPGARVLYRDAARVVVLRSAAEAARS